MAGLTRRLAIAALALGGALAGTQALSGAEAGTGAGTGAEPAPDVWSEWPAAEELGWVQGKADAPLTVIEYFSPTCSHCKEFAETILPGIEKDYIATGKVRFVMREAVRNRVDKAILTQARCLGKDDGLAYLHDVFERQDEVIVAAQIGTLPGTLVIIGTPYGIADREKFDACYTDMNTRFDMQEVETSADHYNVTSTPTFVVNGTVHPATVGLMTPKGFSDFLDGELAKSPATTN